MLDLVAKGDGAPDQHNDSDDQPSGEQDPQETP